MLYRKSKHILFSVTFCFLKNRAVSEIISKIVVEPERPRRQYGTCALHAGLLEVQALKHMPVHSLIHVHTEDYIILLFHHNNGFVNAPHCYVIRTLALGYVVLYRPNVIAFLAHVCCSCVMVMITGAQIWTRGRRGDQTL